MFLINNLYGPYSAETSEGRGANAAHNVVKYIEEGKKITQENMIKFINGEISMPEITKNQALDTLSQAYIQYMPIDEETMIPDYKYALAYSSVYISAFDSDGDGAITPDEAGPLGSVIDFTAPYGKITPGKFLSWLIFQDCVEEYNGVISPREAGASMMILQTNPNMVIDQLKDIYFGHGIDKFEKDFTTPHPITQ